MHINEKERFRSLERDWGDWENGRLGRLGDWENGETGRLGRIGDWGEWETGRIKII